MLLKSDGKQQNKGINQSTREKVSTFNKSNLLEAGMQTFWSNNSHKTWMNRFTFIVRGIRKVSWMWQTQSSSNEACLTLIEFFLQIMY